MNKRTIIVVAVVLVVAGVGVFLAYRSQSNPNYDRPTLLFFYDENCPFCKELMPIVNGLEREYGRRLNVVYLNQGEEAARETARQYGVIGTPTIVLVNSDGEVVNVLRGTIPQPLIEDAVENLLQ